MKTSFFLMVYGLLTGISLSTSLAQSHEPIKGNRQINTQERKIAGFTKLHISMGITAEITDGSAGTIEVEAENNVLPYILTEVKGDTLLITTDKNQPLQDITPIVVRLGIDRLTSFQIEVGALVKARKPIHENNLVCTISSGGQLRADLTVSEFNLTLKSGAKATLSGRVDKATASLSGGSRLAAEDLTFSQCAITLSGGSDADLRVDKMISATATGESRLSYTGNPTVKSAQTAGSSTIRNASAK